MLTKIIFFVKFAKGLAFPSLKGQAFKLSGPDES